MNCFMNHQALVSTIISVLVTSVAATALIGAAYAETSDHKDGKPMLDGNVTAIDPQLLIQCGSDPIVFLFYFKYRDVPMDVHTMKNEKGTIRRECRMRVTYRIEHFVAGRYEYFADGYICLPDANTKNVYIADEKFRSRIVNINAGWSSCSS